MEKMTDQEHFEAAAYMIRNLYTSDDEQTRIEDENYLDELPKELAIACKYLTDAKGDIDYDGAIVIYARWHLRQVVKHGFNWHKYHRYDFEKACNTVYDSLWDLNGEIHTKEELADIEQWRVEIKEWIRLAEEILI